MKRKFSMLSIVAVSIFTLLGSATAARAQTFTVTGSMSTARFDHTATLLPNGKVLIAGGVAINAVASSILSSAELYDPTTGTFAPTGSMANARAAHTATLLPDGKVLIAGGNDVTGNELASAELYDPTTGTFAPTGSMANARTSHTATLLSNGQVLIAGGSVGPFCQTSISSAELYDPATGSFTTTGSMTAARFQATATLLNSGEVLIAGGGQSSCLGPLASAELYDPATGTFTATGSMNSVRYVFTATLLGSGKVLVAGGSIGPSTTSSADLYDAATGTFTATGSMSTPRTQDTAALLGDGQVLVAGGQVYPTIAGLSSAELYDPATATFSPTGSMTTSRTRYTATLLPNGNVLVVGGINSAGVALASAELYGPANQPPVANAGANQTIECAGPSGASVTLNGSASNDPDGDTLTYKWTDPSNNVIGTSAMVSVTAPLGTTIYTLTVTDSGGLSSSATTNVTVRDTRPPTLTLSKTYLSTILPTASATGATVSLAGVASATDVCDANPTITSNVPANDFFPIGVTQVEFTATDHSGNSSPSQTLQVQVEYNFIGYFVPILNDGSAIYQSGRTIPVKFELTAADGTIVTNAVANLFVAMTSNLAIGTNDMTDATASGGSDTGNLFRFDPTSGDYIYNLSTGGFATGTWLARATINDGTVHNVLFSIR